MAKETAKAKKARLAEEAAEQQQQDDGEGVEFQEGDGAVVAWDDVDDSTFEIMQRGNYGVMCSECEFDYSQAKGTPMWSLVWEVEDGEYEGRKLFSHMVMAGKGLPITKKQLGRIRPDLLEQDMDAEDEATIESMIGTRAIAKVTTKKYEGEMRNNIRDLFAPDEGDGFS